MEQDNNTFTRLWATKLGQVCSNHRLNISLRYTFNASKSKYKGTGAGQAERQRM